MDLRNNHITVRELLNDPKAKAVLERRFPGAMGMPIVVASGALTLERTLKLVSAYIPQRAIEETLKELRGL